MWGARRSLSVKALSLRPNCVQNKDYYLRGNVLWVKQKCRGRYQVKIQKAGILFFCLIFKDMKDRYSIILDELCLQRKINSIFFFCQT